MAGDLQARHGFQQLSDAKRGGQLQFVVDDHPFAGRARRSHEAQPLRGHGDFPQFVDSPPLRGMRPLDRPRRPMKNTAQGPHIAQAPRCPQIRYRRSDRLCSTSFPRYILQQFADADGQIQVTYCSMDCYLTLTAR